LIGASASWVADLLFSDSLHHFTSSGFGRCDHHISRGRASKPTPNRLTSHGNGLSLLTGFRIKAFNDGDLNVLMCELLNVFHEAFLIQ
jgi:hypothetical protein